MKSGGNAVASGGKGYPSSDNDTDEDGSPENSRKQKSATKSSGTGTSNNSDNSSKHDNSSGDSDSDTEGSVETVVTSSTSSSDASDDDGSPDNFRKRKSATLSSGICTTFTLVQMEAISLKMKKFYKRIECVKRNSDDAIKTMLGQMRKETTGKKNKATPTCAASTETP